MRGCRFLCLEGDSRTEAIHFLAELFDVPFNKIGLPERMRLETLKLWGLFEGSTLVAAASTGVFSPEEDQYFFDDYLERDYPKSSIYWEWINSEASKPPENTFHLRDFGVRKEFRKQGLGRSFIVHLIEYARENSHPWFMLDSSMSLNAKPFYLRCGFKAYATPGKCWRFMKQL